MIDFDEILDARHASTTVAPEEARTVMLDIDVVAPTITTTVTATPKPSGLSDRRAFLAKPDSEWAWDDLRDYCISEMERWHGPQVRDFKKEAAIFKSFLSRWPDGQAQRIARFAFENQQGMWRSAPITSNRFCRASDPYFASPIMDRLS